eukprot:617781-Amphidinium_carterae.1
MEWVRRNSLHLVHKLVPSNKGNTETPMKALKWHSASSFSKWFAKKVRSTPGFVEKLPILRRVR